MQSKKQKQNRNYGSPFFYQDENEAPETTVDSPASAATLSTLPERERDYDVDNSGVCAQCTASATSLTPGNRICSKNVEALMMHLL